MVKYNYVPESELMPEKQSYEPLPDGHYNFAVINSVSEDGKDDRVDLALEGCGRKGRKSAFFSENRLWYLVKYLKSIGRMDLYSQKGETDLSQTQGRNGSLMLVTKFSTKHGKEYQNIEFVERNKFHDEKPHHAQQAANSQKSEIDKSWEYDSLDNIPF